MSYAAFTISSFLEDSSQKIMKADATVAPTLTQLMLHPAKEVVRPALLAVGNIMTGDDEQTETMINCQVVPSLLWLVDYPDALWTLSNITAGNEKQIQAVINTGVVPKVIPFLANLGKETKEEKNLFTETVWLLGNIFLVEEGLQTDNDSSRAYVLMFVKRNHVKEFFENLEKNNWIN